MKTTTFFILVLATLTATAQNNPEPGTRNAEPATGFLLSINTTGQTRPYKAATAAQADSIILAATGVKLSTDSLTAGPQPYFFAEIYIEKKQAVKTKSGKTKLKKLKK